MGRARWGATALMVVGGALLVASPALSAPAADPVGVTVEAGPVDAGPVEMPAPGEAPTAEPTVEAPTTPADPTPADPTPADPTAAGPTPSDPLAPPGADSGDSAVPGPAEVLAPVAGRVAAPTTPAGAATTPAPTSASPVDAPAAVAAAAAPYYRNCDEARAAGAAPIRRGQPGYRPGLDRDQDGVACEAGSGRGSGAGSGSGSADDGSGTTGSDGRASTAEPAARPDGGLPYTGTPALAVLAAGAALLLGGGGLAFVGRRR